MGEIKTINGATSKGNQPKFLKDDWFYKIDYMGYESISEALVSEFLYYVEGVEYIDYYLEKIIYHKEEVYCCKSKVYIKDGESFISIYKILENSDKLKGLKKVNGKDAVNFIVDCVKEVTNLDIRNYLALLTVIDSLILNEDRHLNNICLIKGKTGYRVAPIFDNGLSLLSDINDYPLGDSIGRLVSKVKCRPFNTSFKKQLGYFNIKPLVVDWSGFMSSLYYVEQSIDECVPFKQKEYLRARSVLFKRLIETEGELWVKK